MHIAYRRIADDVTFRVVNFRGNRVYWAHQEGNMLHRWVVCLLLSSVLAPFAPAQVNTSSIAGVVTDESGSLIPAASISAIQLATGLERKTQTGENGEYVLPQLPPGKYEITAKATGFQTAVVKDLTLAIAQ